MENREDPTQEQLVRRAAEQSRLLPNEVSESTDPEDIRHWISIYGELLTFKSRTLDEMHARIRSMSAVAALEVSQIDIALIERQRRRYQGRLAFWERRAREVAGPNRRASAEG